MIQERQLTGYNTTTSTTRSMCSLFLQVMVNPCNALIKSLVKNRKIRELHFEFSCHLASFMINPSKSLILERLITPALTFI